VALIVAFGLMAGAYRRLSFGVAMTVAAATLVLLPFVVAQVAPTRYGTNTASTLVSHQLEGLAHPLNPHHSTLVTHFSIVVSGLHSALSEPVGLGVGAISIAGSKFGGVVRGTEADPSNVAVALGIPGLLTYIVVLVLGFLRAYGVATKRHDRLAFAALGILTLTNFQWLNGGQYAVAFLPWLILGWVDRQAQVVEAPTDQVARPRHVRGSASEARPGAVGT
jgi:hypothetical protein